MYKSILTIFLSLVFSQNLMAQKDQSAFDWIPIPEQVGNYRPQPQFEGITYDGKTPAGYRVGDANPTYLFISPARPDAPALQIHVNTGREYNTKAFQNNLQLVRNASIQGNEIDLGDVQIACAGPKAMGPKCLRTLKGVTSADLVLKRTIGEVNKRNKNICGNFGGRVLHEVMEEYPADLVSFSLANFFAFSGSPLAADPAAWEHYFEQNLMDPWTHAQLVAMSALDPVLRGIFASLGALNDPCKANAWTIAGHKTNKSIFEIRPKAANTAQKTLSWLMNPLSMGLGTMAIQPIMMLAQDKDFQACLSSSMGRKVSPTSVSFDAIREFTPAEAAAAENACEGAWIKWTDPNSNHYSEVKSMTFGIMTSAIAGQGLLKVLQAGVGGADDLLAKAIAKPTAGVNVSYVLANGAEILGQKAAREQAIKVVYKGLKVPVAWAGGMLATGFWPEVIIGFMAFELMEPIGQWIDGVLRSGVVDLNLFKTTIGNGSDHKHIQESIGVFQTSFESLLQGKIATNLDIAGVFSITAPGTSRQYSIKPSTSFSMLRNRLQSWREFLIQKPIEEHKNWSSAVGDFQAVFAAAEKYYSSVSTQLTEFRGYTLTPMLKPFAYVNHNESTIFSKPFQFYRVAPRKSPEAITEEETVELALQELTKNPDAYRIKDYQEIANALNFLKISDEDLFTNQGLTNGNLLVDANMVGPRIARAAIKTQTSGDPYYKNALYLKDVIRNTVTYRLMILQNRILSITSNSEILQQGGETAGISAMSQQNAASEKFKTLRCFNSASNEYSNKLKCDFSKPGPLRLHFLLGSPKPAGTDFQLYSMDHPFVKKVPNEERGKYPSAINMIGTPGIADFALVSLLCGPTVPKDTSSIVYRNINPIQRSMENLWGVFQAGHPLFSRPGHLNMNGFGWSFVFTPPNVVWNDDISKQLCKWKTSDSDRTYAAFTSGFNYAFAEPSTSFNLINGSSPLDSVFYVEGVPYYGIFDVLKDYIDPKMTEPIYKNGEAVDTRMINWWNNGPSLAGKAMARYFYMQFDNRVRNEMLPAIVGTGRPTYVPLVADYNRTQGLYGQSFFKALYPVFPNAPTLLLSLSAPSAQSATNIPPAVNSAYSGLSFSYSVSAALVKEIEIYEATLRHATQFISSPTERTKYEARIRYIMNQIAGHVDLAQKIYFGATREQTRSGDPEYFCANSSGSERCFALNRLMSLYRNATAAPVVARSPKASPLTADLEKKSASLQDLIQRYKTSVFAYMTDRSIGSVNGLSTRDPILQSAYMLNVHFAKFHLELLKDELANLPRLALNPRQGQGSVRGYDPELESMFRAVGPEYAKVIARAPLYIENTINQLNTLRQIADSVNISGIPDEITKARNPNIFNDEFLNALSQPQKGP